MSYSFDLAGVNFTPGVAERVAVERGEIAGGTVGYQIRLERRVSDHTRLLFVTTGILLRRLQADPQLDGVTHVILDEVGHVIAVSSRKEMEVTKKSPPDHPKVWSVTRGPPIRLFQRTVRNASRPTAVRYTSAQWTQIF